MELDVCLENFGTCQLEEHVVLYHEDLKAVNTAQQEAVTPRYQKVEQGSVCLSKHSWNMLRFVCM